MTIHGALYIPPILKKAVAEDADDDCGVAEEIEELDGCGPYFGMRDAGDFFDVLYITDVRVEVVLL